MACVVVTPNSTLSWAGAADMMDVPMDLCTTISASRSTTGNPPKVKRTYARNAIDEMITT